MAQPPLAGDRSDIRLDDLYRMTARIYAEQNIQRPPSATFAHFAEVCGMLCSMTRGKRRGELTFDDALCKALGWFFPLMAKFKVRSIEEIIFRKYPGVCPYCRKRRHEDYGCKSVSGPVPGVIAHDELRDLYSRNWDQRPASLDEWRRMFQDIYPRSIDDRTGRSSLGLMEELGELAEAIRVFDAHPKYFAGEAADVFSYLMGIANEHWLDMAKRDSLFSLEDEFLIRYPGVCRDCGYPECKCPPIPPATVGRMAKELDIWEGETLFVDHIPGTTDGDRDTADATAKTLLYRLGGRDDLIERFPVDRGAANASLVHDLRLLADALNVEEPETAMKIRQNAIRLESLTTPAGTASHSADAKQVVHEVRDLLSTAPAGVLDSIPDLGVTAEVLFPRKSLVLIVSCAPTSEPAIRAHSEGQRIAEAIKRSRYRDRFEVEQLPAATFDSLRRRLLEQDGDTVTILHFAGHGNFGTLIFEDDSGTTAPVPIDTVRHLIERYPTIECVVITACYSLDEVTEPIGRITIGMENSVYDDAALEFSRGFYDAIGAGRSFAFAVDEGIVAVEGKGLGSVPVKILSQDPNFGQERVSL